jgi:tetratricopeptide (TPR) repeat protein
VKPRFLIAFAAAAVVAACGGKPARPSPQLPLLDDMEPAVAEKLRTAHARIVADPAPANWAWYARTLHAHGLTREAIEPYLVAAEGAEMPEKFKLAYLAGHCATKPDPERAIVLLREAEKLRNDYLPLHLRLGGANEALGRWDEAGKSYERAEELNARERKPLSDPLAGLGRVRLAQGRVADAVAVLERARGLDPENADVHAALAAAYARSGRKDESERARLAAGDLQDRHGFPDAIASEMRQEGVSYKALELLGSAALLGGNYEKALASFERALALRPNEVDAMLNKAQALCALNRFAEAEVLCDQALGTRADSPVALGLKGTCALARGDHRGAVGYLSRTLELDPGNATVRWNLARALRALSSRPEAVRHLHTILAAKPHRSDVRLELAGVLEELGKTGDAIAEVDRVLAREPENRAAQALRARLGR